MPAAKRFEDLLIWQRARELANLTYKITGQSCFRDSALRDQMRRAAVSVMSNIAEGFGRGSNEEFQRFLYIARGSLTELRSQLYLASDLKYLSDAGFTRAANLYDQAARLIQSFAKSMRSANGGSFRRRKEQKPWSERVRELMKEIQDPTKED